MDTNVHLISKTGEKIVVPHKDYNDSEMLKDGNDISFEKVAMFNCLSGGSFEISEVLKAKLMSSLMKDDKAIENLPVEKLMVIQMLEDGEFDAQKLLEFKLAEKLLAE